MRDFASAECSANFNPLHTRAALTAAAAERAARLAPGAALTAQDRETLAGYAGLGPLADLFPDARGEFTDKAFAAYGARLRAAIGDAAFDRLRPAILTSYYTPAEIVREMVAALVAANLPAGARVLEPGCGAGAFLTECPADWRLVGIERDPVAARIAALLRPSAEVREADMTAVAFGQEFDVAIGNVPFGETRHVFDGHKMPVADYFVLRAVDALVPGGVAVLLASRNVMDKADDTARRLIDARAELVSAIRLPSSVFARDDARIVTDILVLRRRDDAGAAALDWLTTEEVELSDNPDADHRMNEFFIRRADAILGTLGERSSRFGPTLDVRRTEDFGARLRRWSETLVVKGPAVPAIAPDPLRATTEPEGTLVVGEDRRIFCARGGWLVAAEYRGKPLTADGPGKTGPLTAALIGLAEQRARIVAAQTGAGDAEAERESGRAALARFHRRHGPINRVKHSETGDGEERSRLVNLIGPFRDDPRLAYVAALEDYDEDTDSAKPSRILRENVVATSPEPNSAPDAKAALVISLARRGRVDLDFMGWLLRDTATGGARERVIAELGDLIFRDPARREWLLADEYLSGDVREKLDRAEAAARSDPDLRRNVDALTDVQPPALTFDEIDVKLGSVINTAGEIAAFARDLLGVCEGIDVERAGADAWKVSASYAVRCLTIATTDFGTARANAIDLIEAALNQRRFTITDETTDPVTGNPKRVTNNDETMAARDKIALIGQKFTEWLRADDTRRAAVTARYNRQFNRLRAREYSGDHLIFPGLELGMEMGAHQSNAIWRALASPYGSLIAHGTGFGKTATYAGICRVARYLGIAQRPMVTVPNHLTLQTAAEFIKFYPTARVIVAGKDDVTRRGRQRFLAKVAQSDADAIVIGHSAFERIPVSDEFRAEFVERELDELRDVLSGFGSDASSGSTRRAKRAIETAIEKASAKLVELTSGKDQGITLNDLGIDLLLVDEAHFFKNRTLNTKLTGVAGINPNGSQRADDMYLKCRLVERAGKIAGPVIMGTATPIANSIAEVRTFLDFLAGDLLREMGIGSFDAFAAQFFDVIDGLEISPDGAGLRPVSRLGRFVNLPEMLAIWSQVADVKLAGDVALPLPAVAGGRKEIVSVALNEDARAIQHTLVKRLEKIKNGGVQPKDDNALAVTTDGRLLALDPRLIDALAAPGAKLPAVADLVAANWRASAAIDGTQIVFMNGGLRPSPRTGFCAYDELIAMLVAQGIPRSQIVTCRDEINTPAKEAKVHADLRAGRKRVFITNDIKGGVGLNIAERLYASYDVDFPWRPAEMIQRDGRIVRQSNQCPRLLAAAGLVAEVRQYSFLTVASFDARIAQLLSAKARVIEAVMRAEIDQRSMDDVGSMELAFEEMKAIASGEPAFMVLAEAKAQAQKLRTLRVMYGNTQRRLERKVDWLGEQITKHERRALYLEHDLATATANAEAGLSLNGAVVAASPQGVEGADQAEINRAFGQAFDRARAAVQGEHDRPVRFARLRGFDCILAAEREFLGFKHVIRLAGRAEHVIEPGKMAPGSVLRALNASIDQIEDRIARSRRIVTEARAEITEARARLGVPFAQNDTLREIEAIHDEIEAQMRMDAGLRDRPGLDAAIRRFDALSARFKAAPTQAAPSRKADTAASVVARLIAEATARAESATPEDASAAIHVADAEPETMPAPAPRGAPAPGRVSGRARANPRPRSDPRQLSLLDAFF
jgi:N12 class adenine-specific DNA methylase